MKQTTPQLHKVYIKNALSIGSQCGYGQGTTRAAAIKAALALVAKRDPSAYYDGMQVIFSPIN